MGISDLIRRVFGTRRDPVTQEERDATRALFADHLARLEGAVRIRDAGHGTGERS